MTTTTKIKKTGMKFTEKYSLETATIYRGNTDALKIPGPDHPLYDPTAPKKFDKLRVRAIDRDGKMSTPIEVYTDPDNSILWVLDGRGRYLDVQEVNRRRAAEGRELVEPLIVPFPGDEKEAIARLYEKNYHRRLPSPTSMAIGIRDMRKAGHSWQACAEALHQETDDAEQWARKLLPLAYCIPEVQKAVDDHELPRSAARKFGGGKPDGSAALGRREQLDMLALVTSEKVTHDFKKKAGALPKPIAPKARERVREALCNGETAQLKATDKIVARVAAAVIARIGGFENALKEWPEVDAIFEGALESKKPEKKGKKNANKKDEAQTE